MSALRKLVPPPWHALTETEKAFCRDFVASVRLNPTQPAYWARVGDRLRWDELSRPTYPLSRE
jgi:hypothetical protein